MDIFELNGEKIRELRESIPWTREFLSEKSGIPARTIADIEMGKSKNPGLQTIIPLLKAMKAQAPGLLESQSETPKSKSDLIFTIVSALPTLNEIELSQLIGVLGSFDSMAPAKKKSSQIV